MFLYQIVNNVTVMRIFLNMFKNDDSKLQRKLGAHIILNLIKETTF